MKQYPRIFSLSTAGLIHHREFDYLFHPFRTDFIGESGSGKSMIADLIQLIFVGSDAFESATKATDIRDPQGMVLKTQKWAKGVGYAVLSIEMAPSKYMVVGSYLETGNRSAQSFIIQSGYEWPAIEYVNTPFSFKKLLNGDDILSMDLLPDWLEKQGLHIKSWQRPKEYHKILFTHKIVPLELASSDRILKDYAGILQSFSRGKMLDTQKDDGLKQFLFGQQDARKMLEQFRNAEKDMAQTIGEYGSNLQEIDRVTQKQRGLLELRGIKNERDTLQQTWLYNNLLYQHQESARLDKEINDCAIRYLQAIQHHEILDDLLQDEITAIDESLPGLERLQADAVQKYELLLPEHNNIEKVSDWLVELSCSYEMLEERYTTYRQDQTQQRLLHSFVQLLRNGNLEEIFKTIPDKTSASAMAGYLTGKITDQQQVILQKKLLKQYSNLNDPQSLAYWALQQKRIFSREEESAIVHFQYLPRTRGTNHKDYLPDPAELFLSLSFADTEESGFWINLKGIKKYISYVKEQILDTDDQNKIRAYFNAYSANLENDIRDLETALSKYQSIQKILLEQDNVTQTLTAYSRKEALANWKDIPSLNISKERFDEYRQSYYRRETLEQEFQHAREHKTITADDLNRAKTRQREYQLLAQNMNIASLGEAVYTIIEKIKSTQTDTYIHEKENISAGFNRSEDKLLFIDSQWKLIQPGLNDTGNLPELQEKLTSTRTELAKAEEQYKIWYQTLPETVISKDYLHDPKDDQYRYFQSETRYNEKYNLLIEQYISTEAYRLEGAHDFVELARNLLPEAFYEAVLDRSESSVIDTIASYLTKINEKNRQLNNRKIQKIRDLLDDVDEAITRQENIVRLIDNFLKHGAQITGGYTARLHKTPAVNYPRSWMREFEDLLEKGQHSGMLENRLGEKVDLEAMIREAFSISGGPPSANATVTKLLDPSSYYELSFKMESESGRINKGSTGQTYAAIALLCIARLSIMSNEEGKSAEPAVRVMPIDEAEGLGANYDMLYDIARRYDYQLISLSIGPVSKFKDGEQYLYMLHKNMETEDPVNYTPVAILNNNDKIHARQI